MLLFRLLVVIPFPLWGSFFELGIISVVNTYFGSKNDDLAL